MLKERGAKRALALPVSAPFHSSLLAPAAQRLGQYLAGVPLKAPRVPVIHNVDVARHADAAGIRGALAAQAAGPVRWVECVQALRDAGCTDIVECGPGKVLAGLSRRIDPALLSHALVDLDSAHTIKGNLQ
jgi:[acyl-carrier-protein] S-malonyltransferase